MPLIASAAEIIRSYDVQAKLNASRNLVITEQIEYDFGTASRHGIFRDIPKVYSRNGGNYNYRYEVLSVFRDGKQEPFSESSIGSNHQIKIGDKDKNVTGAHTYTITYQTDRAITDFPNSEELYWNVVGVGWQIPIETAHFSVQIPETTALANVTSTCFVGTYGSTEASCKTTTQGSELHVETTRVLEPHEGFTIVMGFPKGTFVPKTFWSELWHFLQDNGVLLIPIAAFIFMFFRWWSKGRDPRLAAIIPEYEPPQEYVPATMAAAATEGTVPDRSITATIIDLAQRGYLHIRFGEEKGLLFGTTQTYTFVKTNKSSDDLKNFEQEIYKGIFDNGDEVTLDELKKPSNEFYKNIANFKRDVQKEIDTKNLFDKNPSAVRGTYISVGFLITWGLLFFFTRTGIAIVSGVLTGLIIAIFGWFMPRRNAAGSEFLRKAKGFEWFMSVTEKDRLDFHNAPERTPEQFMAVLPFAIAFGLEKKWAAQFAGLNIPPPNWAEGSNISTLSMAHLVSNVGDLHTAAASSFSPPSSAGSGGSGFSGGGSGGGGGGGGGGSW